MQGRGIGRGGANRFPPCDICGRQNHSVERCWSNPNSPYFRGAQFRAIGGCRGRRGGTWVAVLAPVAEDDEVLQQAPPPPQDIPDMQGNA